MMSKKLLSLLPLFYVRWVSLFNLEPILWEERKAPPARAIAEYRFGVPVRRKVNLSNWQQRTAFRKREKSSLRQRSFGVGIAFRQHFPVNQVQALEDQVGVHGHRQFGE